MVNHFYILVAISLKGFHEKLTKQKNNIKSLLIYDCAKVLDYCRPQEHVEYVGSAHECVSKLMAEDLDITNICASMVTSNDLITAIQAENATRIFQDSDITLV